MKAALASSSTASRSVSTPTAFHFMSSWVHLVTQLISTAYSLEGSSRNCVQVQVTGWRTNPSIVKLHCSVRIRGVGPAESTGKLLTRYWPGGTRPARSGWRRLPVKPRETSFSAIRRTLAAGGYPGGGDLDGRRAHGAGRKYLLRIRSSRRRRTG